MRDWKDYSHNRLIFKSPSGFYVIIPKNTIDHQPVFCPICESVMTANLDDEAYKNFKCCDSCATFWAYPNKEKWLSGWRPSPDEVSNKYDFKYT